MVPQAWAKAKQLNSAADGTLSSYAWVLLVVHYLQVTLMPPHAPTAALLVVHYLQIPPSVSLVPAPPSASPASPRPLLRCSACGQMLCVCGHGGSAHEGMEA